MNIRNIFTPLFILVFTLFPLFDSISQVRFNEDILKGFSYRNLGPYRLGARISDIAVPDFPSGDHLYTYYVGTWSGGLWKTTNNGTTFEPLFDEQPNLNIGDVALAPSDPDVVWVGTGDAFNSRTSYSGDGVYRSTDAGSTWENMGLRDSHHIARIVIHPENPDIVYAAAMGHLYSDNEERGVFKTTDGGKTWEKSLYISEKVGVTDLVMNQDDPAILYAAAYEKQRLPWVYVNNGPGSGIYMTEDAGNTWTRLAGGLPDGKIGRIGIDIYLRNPDILYAVIENANTRPPTEQEIEQDRQRGRESQERVVGGEVYRTDNAGKSWTKMNSAEDNIGSKSPYYFNQLRIDPNNDQNIFVTGVSLSSSTDGGRSWYDIDWPPRRLFSSMFGDVRTLWIDPENSNRIIMGSDGGIYVSYDGGRTCDHRDNLPLGEFYAIGVDMEDPYNIYGGMQDHEMWKSPSNGPGGDITQFDWTALGGGDGMYTLVDPEDSRWLYTTRQHGSHYRVDQKLGYQVSIRPQPAEGKPPYRFIWCTPLHISPHNSRIIYAGAQVLLRSVDRGDHWQEISPDLSTNDTAKMISGTQGGIPWFAISTISESPITPGIIWVGTCDGKVHVTKNGGTEWTNLTKNIAAEGCPENYYVSRIFASNYNEGTAYITKSGYDRDDFGTFLYKTEDFGETWTSLEGDLPESPVNVIIEDSKNPDLLFLGNDKGVFVSIDRGKHWVNMNNRIPVVPVRDLIVHPRENDLVVATYGRGLFVTDVSVLQGMSENVLDEKVYLFEIEPKAQRITHSFGANDYLFGDNHLRTRNESGSLIINFYLKDEFTDNVKITITDAFGEEKAVFERQANAGMNSLTWNMRSRTVGQRGGRGSQPSDPAARLAPPGEYIVTLEAAGEELTRRARVTKTTGWSVGPFPVIIRK
ncbi:WD40/YVTN/BNR-like repeat-containing protein [candidate division KSB1 bacterium]